MIELTVRDPCDICEGIAGRAETWTVIDESANTITVLNPHMIKRGQAAGFLQNRPVCVGEKMARPQHHADAQILMDHEIERGAFDQILHVRDFAYERLVVELGVHL